ncbi:hypothetical protein UVI_02051810 [Ustilaginoidea virens]|uniref:DUF6590 domain-containing protein n=1 Tax=Ustilaginoidea virens TaxID=1159556 RepID=A0A1B5LAF2_USTVR|nr:hypothetical protein UVI_02051810 [Ustilaginoidea virens]
MVCCPAAELSRHIPHAHTHFVLGNLDYDFNFDYADGARTPRDSQRIDELAADFQNLSPGSNYEAQGEFKMLHPANPSHLVFRMVLGIQQVHWLYYALDSGQQERHRSSKPKGKERERERDRERVKDRDRDKDKSKDKSKDKIKGKDKDKDRTKHQHHDKHHRKDYSDSSKSHLEQLDQAYTKEDETRQMQQAVAESQQVQYGIIRGSAKGPSDMAYTSSAYGTRPSSQNSGLNARLMIVLSKGYDVEDDESSTPKGGLMATDEDEFEEIDPRHAGQLSLGCADAAHRPILTYGGKACNKHGVKPAKHGIVYEHGHKPHMVSGEPKLGFPPVQATITEDGERLSKESRVNYSKLVTIEHNIRVFFIGSIMPNSLDIIKEAVNDCWYQKNHQRKRS